ncbi:hypothetical protein DWQ65_03470 [Treponema phagedenis]|uniref:Uncharacterized protein n=1 Tax=Treponema phagedenis TaxID=162 RepID=A0A0B7GPS6_TREPH|nr:hypothetical protein DWQ65_03470 [Treponema phagedenis]CEM60559.1 hypothetical protein TPHV1_10227 [Treponema phagedenis]
MELQKKKIDSFLDTVKDLKTEYQEGVTKQKTVKSIASLIRCIGLGGKKQKIIQNTQTLR